MKRASKSAKPFITAVLSVNGNEGFAMIGDGRDIGPAAFKPVIPDEVPGNEAWESAARQASEQALRKRQARFPDRLIHGAWQTLDRLSLPSGCSAQKPYQALQPGRTKGPDPYPMPADQRGYGPYQGL